MTEQKIKYLASCNDDVLPESTNPDYQFKYVDISSVSTGSINSEQQFSFSNAPSRARRLAQDGDVVISTVRTYLKAVTNVDTQHANDVFSTGFAVLRPYGIDSRFFYYAVLNDHFMQRVESESTGISYPAITAQKLINLPINLPNHKTQRAIADYLDEKTGAIDAAIKDIERSIELLNEYRQSVISEAVTKGLDPTVPMKDSGIDWIGQIPETWNGLRMKAILNRIEQGWSPSAALSIDENNGWHVLTLSAVKHGSFIADAVKPIDMNFAIPANLELSDGDLLMTRANTKELVGDVCLVDDCPPHVIPSDLIYRLTLNRSLALPRFIMYALLSNMVRRQISAAAKGSSGTMPKISHNIIKQLQLCLPPLSEQQSIINHLDNATAAIDSLIQQKRSLVVRLKEYRTSLISECVTGKVKVPGVEE